MNVTIKRPKCSSYETKYCCKCLVLFLFFSFRNAHDSICLILSLLTPIILQYVPSETLAPCHVIAEWILMGEIRNVSLCH